MQVLLTHPPTLPPTHSPEKMEASTMPVAISERVPQTFTKKTQRPVAKALPLPVLLMRKLMNRSKAGARLTERANRGNLHGKIHTVTRATTKGK